MIDPERVQKMAECGHEQGVVIAFHRPEHFSCLKCGFDSSIDEHIEAVLYYQDQLSELT